VLDAGYDTPRIAHLLSGLPVEILGRTRSDRVLRRPTPPRVYGPQGGRPANHGGEFIFGDPATWGEEQAVTRFREPAGFRGATRTDGPSGRRGRAPTRGRYGAEFGWPRWKRESRRA
jgi:hypothetical protein